MTMVGLFTPVWLLGLAALAVPVALHLWSRRAGRPIRVGSIRLLAGAPPAMARSWAIHDPWLLAVRCAVLASLVLCLAGPYWAPRPAAGPTWALVASNAAGRITLADSLRRAGLDVYHLDRGDLWLALRAADRAAPPETRFLVFAPLALRDFHGVRPILRTAVEWHPVAAAPRDRIPLAGAGATRIVAILADSEREEDARYVAAAVRAVAQATGIPAIVAVRSPSRPGEAASTADWLVWLSGREIPEAIRQRVHRGATLMSDAGGAPATARRTRIRLAGRPSDAWLERRSTGVDGAAPLWTDGSGTALLTVAREGRGLHYRYHSRFLPSWSDFVLRASFPEAMARLWTGVDSLGGRGDDRRIALSQALPGRDPGPPGIPASRPRSLFVPAWLLAVALFLAERRLAARPLRRSA